MKRSGTALDRELIESKEFGTAGPENEWVTLDQIPRPRVR